MDKNHQDLLGKEINYIAYNGKTAKIFVAQIDYGKGITCKGNFDSQADDAELVDIICLNKNDWDNSKYDWMGYKSWGAIFNDYIARLRTGKYVGKVPTGSYPFSPCIFE